MTLKKCTVTQLDDRFSRVEWDGPATRLRRDGRYANSPLIVEGTRGCASPWHNYRRDTLDELLEDFGLTRHDKPETAEERVRAAVDMSEPPLQADLRAILAELDRVRRERDERTEGWRKTERKLAKLSKDMREVSEMLFESKVEVERLRSGMMPAAQRPVDVEAVLAPIQRVLSAYRVAPVYGMKYELLARHVVGDLEQSLAEAERIGRGE